MADRYFTHIVERLEASIKTAEDGVDCQIPAVTVQSTIDLLKEQQARIERMLGHESRRRSYRERAGLN